MANHQEILKHWRQRESSISRRREKKNNNKKSHRESGTSMTSDCLTIIVEAIEEDNEVTQNSKGK